MATVQIENIDRLIASFRESMERRLGVVIACWHAIEPTLRRLAPHIRALEDIERARRRTMHTAYSRRLRARRRRNR